MKPQELGGMTWDATLRLSFGAVVECCRIDVKIFFRAKYGMCQHIANGFWQEGFDGFTLGEATRKDLGMTFSSRVSSREKEKG